MITIPCTIELHDQKVVKIRSNNQTLFEGHAETLSTEMRAICAKALENEVENIDAIERVGLEIRRFPR